MTHKESSSREPRSADDETFRRSERAGGDRTSAEGPATLNDDDDLIDEDEVLVEDDEDQLPD